jgi:D-sedoheptulose 7-phosphate isomerase
MRELTNYIDEHIRAIEQLRKIEDLIEAVSQDMVKVLKSGGKILIAGNGGSAADSQHFAAELTGRFELERTPLPGIALTVDSSALTAIANDYSYDDVFSRQLKALGTKKDLFLGISTSGTSRNIRRALDMASTLGMKSVLLTSLNFQEEDLKESKVIKAQSNKTSIIQESHILLIHRFCQHIDDAFRDR